MAVGVPMDSGHLFGVGIRKTGCAKKKSAVAFAVLLSLLDDDPEHADRRNSSA